MYGDNMQSMVPQYLEESLAAFQRNQSQFRDAMAGAFTGGPFAEMARRNMEMFQAAAGGVKPKPEPAPEETKQELAELREQLAALQAKLDKLGG
jgi:polyhydroxyalkanoate synthesis regulator protein